MTKAELYASDIEIAREKVKDLQAKIGSGSHLVMFGPDDKTRTVGTIETYKGKPTLVMRPGDYNRYEVLDLIKVLTEWFVDRERGGGGRGDG